jgi:hypothetical protein
MGPSQQPIRTVGKPAAFGLVFLELGVGAFFGQGLRDFSCIGQDIPFVERKKRVQLFRRRVTEVSL